MEDIKQIQEFFSKPLEESVKEAQGGSDTSWTDIDNGTITLQDILELTKDIKIINFPTKKLANIVLNWDDNPEEIERISQVEVSSQYPILIMVDESGVIKWILDGNHRAQKALRSKSKTIPAKLIKPSNLNSKARKILLGIVENVDKKKEEAVNESKLFSNPKYWLAYEKDDTGQGEDWLNDRVKSTKNLDELVDNVAREEEVKLSTKEMSSLMKTAEMLIKANSFVTGNQISAMISQGAINEAEIKSDDKFANLKGRKIVYSGTPGTVVYADENRIELEDKNGNIRKINYNMFTNKGFIKELLLNL